MPPLLEAIQGNEDYVCKEHFDEFFSNYMPGVNRKLTSKAFNSCVRGNLEPDTSLAESSGDVYSILEVTTREELGYSPYVVPYSTSSESENLAQYCINVGSLLKLHKGSFNQQPMGNSEILLSSFIVNLSNQVT